MRRAQPSEDDESAPAQPHTRAEIAARRERRVARANELRNRGLIYTEIAAEMGIALSTVHRLLKDPSGKAAAKRKARYNAPCPRCGRRMVSEGSYVPDRLCRQCFMEVRREQRRAYYIQALQAWAALYDDPPRAVDWNPAMARRVGLAKAAARFERGEGAPEGGWPQAGSVRVEFGSWNAAIAAAGFAPRSQGSAPPLAYEDAIGALIRRYRAGEPIHEIRNALRISERTLYSWLDRAGEPRRKRS